MALSQHPEPRYRIELLERIREAYRRSGNFDRAIEVQQQVVEEIQPNDRYRALSTLAYLHKESKRHAEAVNCAERAIVAATNLDTATRPWRG